VVQDLKGVIYMKKNKWYYWINPIFYLLLLLKIIEYLFVQLFQLFLPKKITRYIIQKSNSLFKKTPYKQKNKKQVYNNHLMLKNDLINEIMWLPNNLKTKKELNKLSIRKLQQKYDFYLGKELRQNER